MEFRVIEPGTDIDRSKRDVVYLKRSNWDDWFKFETTFSMSYTDNEGVDHFIGGTKIGSFGLLPNSATAEPEAGYRKARIPQIFTNLPEEFFSLGQDTSFYENLGSISGTFRESILKSIRDVAYDLDLLSKAKSEEVMRFSLLREVPLTTVRDQFARLARGGARLTPYKFSYRGAPVEGHEFEMVFDVSPNSSPPSNLQVLVGRNGVGKSTLLNTLANAFVKGSASPTEPASGNNEEKPQSTTVDLSNVVSVSFSAFDAFEPISVPQDRTKGLSYHYVGLKKISPKRDDSGLKDKPALSRDMTISAKSCLQGARRPRWLRAIRLLEGDPIFAEAGLADLIADETDDKILETLPGIFKRLSSGHTIVLLTVTRLVETVEEKSLVLLDEPETHLHPPLLSAFVRSLSDLLTNRNGMAIIATHSPVVLQEVPSACVWKLNRSGNVLTVDRPRLETFAENVGTLTDEVFGLEVISTGFHKMLTDAAATYADYESALASFDGQIGAEGKAILRARIAAKNRSSLNVAR